MSFQGVIFDMDGTLIEPTLDFDWVRAQLDIAPGQDILTAIGGMDAGASRRASDWLNEQELAGIARARAMPHARDVLVACRQAGLKTALLTRNSNAAMEQVLSRLGGELFDVKLSRESGPIKPEPDGVLRCCREMHTRPDRTAAVGDFKYDMVAANAAGALSVLLATGDMPPFADLADHVIRSLNELPALLGI